ncbi:hypothetical protein BUALT_Bualt10G0089900 [Buddleja alternifolia]|uniref:peptidyl-tRNA hydrolase n=1 Tax=Buddleja alternifolia TaxID=168488 RepID=A0AAV6WYX6_9LAMI|nr:hypothetical protein BUALT_Bualt10G0089900 [Buddleja alternifolia]
MASIFIPRCPPIKPHLNTRVAKLTHSSTIFPRTAAPMESSTAANATADAAGDGGQATESSEAETIVQYVVLRRDLIDTWPLGSVVTQGCHASVAAIWLHKDDPHTLLYCSPSNLDSMHKVTLEVKGETQLVNLSEKLKVGGIAHKLWIEQPENIPTCLATKPYPKSFVTSFFKKLKLCLGRKWALKQLRLFPGARSTTSTDSARPSPAPSRRSKGTHPAPPAARSPSRLRRKRTPNTYPFPVAFDFNWMQLETE